jgi:hypothetical protein
MKPKNLSKKIRQLEARLQKGAKKLAKLKQKLGAAAKAGVPKKKGKSGRTEDKNRRLTPITRTQPAAVTGPSAAKKVKRKLNLTPERRAQLAAAMKARWAIKRAAAASTKNTPSGPGFASGQVSQPQ